jgi:hypothetical protein
MNKKTGSRKLSSKQSARLGAYFVASLGASTAATSTADAAIVNIDIGPSGFNIGGINAGVPYTQGSYTYDSKTVSNFPSGGRGWLKIHNGSYVGLEGLSGLTFAITGGDVLSCLRRNDLIG